MQFKLWFMQSALNVYNFTDLSAETAGGGSWNTSTKCVERTWSGLQAVPAVN
jgi:hypothetical protein